MIEHSSSAQVPAGVVRLTDWGVIQASGPDARSFLHGQLTQDVEHLRPGHAALAGYCSAKGRLLASFVVWPVDDEGLALACSADVLAATLERLSRFVLRAKCRLTDVSAGHALYGLAGADALRWLGARALAETWASCPFEGGHAIRLPDAQVDGVPCPRVLLSLPADRAGPALPALEMAAWRALEASSGVARIVAATSEQFVPQMVNLELVGGVSFQKGCYPGQEVVARSQYRGTLKRRAFLVEGETDLSPGQEVFHSADPAQPCGTVVVAGDFGAGRHVALAELKLSACGDGVLTLGAVDGPRLRLGRLPYSVPIGGS